MRILAIETTEKTGTIATLSGSRLLDERRLNDEQRSGQSLAPGLHALLHEVGWKPQEVDLVAVAAGPGSFTGLRVGVTTAKVFAYAVGAEVIGVDSLMATALRAPANVDRLSVVMDAGRGEVFAGVFQREGEETFAAKEATAIVDCREWLAALRPGDVVSGPGLRKLAGELPAGVNALDEKLWSPTAEAVGKLAWQLYEAGHRDDLWQLVPRYYRRSAAEEKLGRQL